MIENKNLILFLFLICVLFLIYYTDDKITWTGDERCYPNGVLNYHHRPPLSDPMNLLSSTEKNLIQKKLKKAWEDQRVALFILIREQIDLENYKIFEAIPNGRTKAIIYTKDKQTQQWGFYIGYRHIWTEGYGRGRKSKSKTIIQSLDIDQTEYINPPLSTICSQLSHIISQQSQLAKPLDREYIVKYKRIQNIVLIIFISVVSLIILSLCKKGKNGWTYKLYYFFCYKELNE